MRVRERQKDGGNRSTSIQGRPQTAVAIANTINMTAALAPPRPATPRRRSVGRQAGRRCGGGGLGKHLLIQRLIQAKQPRAKPPAPAPAWGADSAQVDAQGDRSGRIVMMVYTMTHW